MRFAQTDLPGKTGVFDRSERRRTSAAVVATDGDDVGASLSNARGDDAHARAGDEFNANASARIRSTQIVDQLGEIFDAVNVVVWRRRNERRARSCVPDACDVFRDFARGQLAAFAGLGSLRDFDFELLGVNEVVRGNAATAGGYLLNFVGSLRFAAVQRRIFSAFTGVATAAEGIHRQSEGAMGLEAQ